MTREKTAFLDVMNVFIYLFPCFAISPFKTTFDLMSIKLF